jgi:hypothetical protein
MMARFKKAVAQKQYEKIYGTDVMEGFKLTFF